MKRTLVLLFLLALPAPRVAWAQGDPVGTEFVVNSHTTGAQEQAAVAADPSGNFVVVWISLGQDAPGPDAGIYGQRYDGSGAPLGSEFRVNSYTTEDQFTPKVAADGAGNFVVVWSSYGQDGEGWGIFGQRFASSGTPAGPEFRVNTYTSSSQSYASVAADSAGGFVVVWGSFGQDGLGWGVFGQRYAATGAPLGSEFRVNTYTTDVQWFPTVAADGSGAFVVAWQSFMQDGSSWGVFGQRYASSGAPLGPEFRVNTSTTASQTYPSVAADPSGGFVVAWTGHDLSNLGILGQRYASSGAPLGPEFRVNSHTTGYQISASVAADGAGNFVVAWQSNPQDGDSYGIFGQRYAGTGGPLGPEFRVNTYTTDSQNVAAVAAAPSGDFVVVWRSFGQDGQASAVIGQRYTPIFPVSLTGFSVE